jgi:hypothetical protein
MQDVIMHDGEILTGAEFRRRFPNQASALRRGRDQAGRPDVAADRIRAAMAQTRRQPTEPTPAPHTDLADLLRQTPDEDPTTWR